MKTSIKTLAVLAVALSGAVGISSATSVTYNVDMSVQSALGNFHSGVDTVMVAGTFCNWQPTNTLTQVGSSSVYTLTFNDTADGVGVFENHKFIINPNGTSTGNSLNWESIANRFFPVPATATNLPTVFFNDVTNVPTSTVNITFQVDMQIAVLQNHFTQGSDYVEAMGSFNNWANTGVILTNVPGTTNYAGVFSSSSLSLGTPVNYKYAINGSGGTWEGNVGTGGGQNRIVTVTNDTQTFPLDYWNNVTDPNLSYVVNFAVHVAVEDAYGVFTPGNDAVFVNGTWDWNGDAMQLTQVGSSDLYTGAVSLAYSPGTTVDYKYTFDAGLTWENNGVGPGGAANHQFSLSGDTNLPSDYFNNYANLGPVTITGPAGGQTIVFWQSGTNANNRMWLQSAASLSGAWSDVPNSTGQSSVTNNFGPAPVFFRVTGP